MARTARNIKPSPGKAQSFLIGSDLHSEHPAMSFESREIVRIFMHESSKHFPVEILAWCVLPFSYRIILKVQPAESSGAPEQRHPSIKYTKILQMRISSWLRFQHDTTSTPWRNRYQSTQLETTGDILAASLAINALPAMLDLVDDPADYFFTSYHHAQAGDAQERKNIGNILGTPDANWPDLDRRYQELLCVCLS